MSQAPRPHTNVSWSVPVTRDGRLFAAGTVSMAGNDHSAASTEFGSGENDIAIPSDRKMTIRTEGSLDGPSDLCLVAADGFDVDQRPQQRGWVTFEVQQGHVRTLLGTPGRGDVADLRRTRWCRASVQKHSGASPAAAPKAHGMPELWATSPSRMGPPPSPRSRKALTVPVPPPLRWSGGGEGGCEERRRTEGDADGEQCCARMIPIGDLQTALTVRPTAMVAKAAAPS